MPFTSLPRMNLELTRRKSSQENQTRILQRWLYFMPFAKYGNPIHTNLFFLNLLFYPCVLYSLILYYPKKCPDFQFSQALQSIPNEPGESIFYSLTYSSCFLPKLSEPASTAECQSMKRHEKMLKLSETYRAMTCEYGWGKKKKHHLSCFRPSFVLPKIHSSSA